MGNDETVALTAFVVIALHHGLATFQNNEEELKQQVVRMPVYASTSCSSASFPLGARCVAPVFSVLLLSLRQRLSQGQTRSWERKQVLGSWVSMQPPPQPMP